VSLGSGGSVIFTLDSDGMPISVKWGLVVASVSEFKNDDSYRGTLGMSVPLSYPCNNNDIATDVLSDVSAVEPVDEIEAEATMGLIRRRLSEAPSDEALNRKLAARSIDYQLLTNAISSYSPNQCGEGWTPWFAVQNSNAYAMVCWNANYGCSIAVRGSDDFTDWYANVAGSMSNVDFGVHGGGSQPVPSGFASEYGKLKSASSWKTLTWARSSSHCSHGVWITGHSLGGAVAQLFALENNLGERTVTFASPRVGGTSKMCAGRRYYISSDWGSDPVPTLPPWTTHPMSGYQLAGKLNWFAKSFQLNEMGCGDQGGGGINVYQHSSSQYLYYMDQVGHTA
jgi:hypothetical protein